MLLKKPTGNKELQGILEIRDVFLLFVFKVGKKKFFKEKGSPDPQKIEFQ